MTKPEQVHAPKEGGVLAVEVTPDCNRNCHYCYNGWRLHPETREPVLPTAELVALVKRALQESGAGRCSFLAANPSCDLISSTSSRGSRPQA